METYEMIKKLRKEAKLSQDELARKVGYTDRSSIAKIEAGKVNLPETKIKIFAQALNTSPAELMDIGYPSHRKDYTPWSNNFRQSLVEVLLTVDPADAKDAYVDLNKLQDIAYGSGQLSLEECCEVCSEIGESIDQMARFIDKTLIPENEDERTAKLVELFSRLTPDRQDLILAQLEAIASK